MQREAEEFKSPNMASQAVDPLVKGTSGEKSRTLIRVVILCIVAAAAVASRLFSVIRRYTGWPIYGLRADDAQDSKVLFTNVCRLSPR